MQLQNIECQIAKAQIGRYLAGDALSDETLHQLESHIGKCPDCKQSLAERRSVLQAMLTPAPPEAAPTPETADEPKVKPKADLADFIKSRLQSGKPAEAVVETKPAAFWKPMAYSIALGAVLIAMSYASKNMGSVLGPKAAAKTVAAAPRDVAARLALRPPGAAKANALPAEVFLNAEADARAAATTPAAVKHIAPLSPAKRHETKKPISRTKHRKAPRPATSLVRVYEP